MVSATRTHELGVSEAVRRFVRAASAVLLCMALVGCAGGTQSSDVSDAATREAEAELQRTALVQETKDTLDELKNLPNDQLQKLVESAGLHGDALDANDDQVAEVMAHVLGKAQFDVREVVLREDSADVQVTLRCADVGAALAKTEERMASDEMREPLLGAYQAADDEPFVRQSLDLLFTAIGESDLVSHEITLKLANAGDGNWKVAPESMVALANALYST